MSGDQAHSHHQHPKQPPSPFSWAMDQARKAGLRRTRALEEVLACLVEADRPLTLAEFATLPALEGRFDRATIWRLLGRLEGHGLVRRLGLHDRSARYAIKLPGRHDDYLVCTDCGLIRKLNLQCPVEALESEVSANSGFSGIYHELEFFGTCPDCQPSH